MFDCWKLLCVFLLTETFLYEQYENFTDKTLNRQYGDLVQKWYNTDGFVERMKTSDEPWEYWTISVGHLQIVNNTIQYNNTNLYRAQWSTIVE